MCQPWVCGRRMRRRKGGNSGTKSLLHKTLSLNSLGGSSSSLLLLLLLCFNEATAGSCQPEIKFGQNLQLSHGSVV